MTKKAIIFLFVLNLACSGITDKRSTVEYKIVTENYPPYNYIQNNRITGCCTEIVQEILKRLRMQLPIKLMEWNQAYNLAIHEPGTIIYSMTKTEDRDSLFKWVGPLAKNKWAFFAKSDRKISIRNLDDAKLLKVGAYYDDVCETFLYNEKFTKIECSNEDKNNVKKLLDGSIDLWITGDVQTAYLMARQVGVDPSKIKPVYIIKTQELYIGFYRKTPDKIIQDFQNTLEAIKKDGTYDKIMKKYILEDVVRLEDVEVKKRDETISSFIVAKEHMKELKKIADEQKIDMKDLIYRIFDGYIVEYQAKKNK